VKTDQPSIAILLATFNGEKFLAEQLDSLQAQTITNWQLYVSDDGSTDRTMDIIKHYQKLWGAEKIQYKDGPQKGFAQNFLSLACNSNIKADFYAFCDQDDIWLPEKLNTALINIKANENKEIPYLYTGRTILVNEKLKPYGLSPLFTFPASFRNALVQSIAGGNTMVFNNKIKIFLESKGILNIVSHDWWLYIVVTGLGGNVFYDKNPFILYRQHKNSVVGSNVSLISKFNRLLFVLKGRYKNWNSQNINELIKIKNDLIFENRKTLELFSLMRDANFKDRIRLFQVCGLYRQTRAGSLSLIIALLIKKL